MSNLDPYEPPKRSDIPAHLRRRSKINASDEEQLLQGVGVRVVYADPEDATKDYPASMNSMNTWVMSPNDDGKPSFGRAVLGNLVSSLIASFLVVLVAVWSTIHQEEFGGSIVAVALAQGVGVWLALVLTGAISSDYNPTVIVAEALMPHWRDHITTQFSTAGEMYKSWSKTLILALVVLVGSFGGAILGSLPALSLDASNSYNRGAPVINTGAGFDWRVGLLVESLGSVIWLWAWLVAHYDRKRSTLVSPPIFLGFVHTMLVLLGYNYTRGSFNMWRHLAPALIGGVFGTPAADHAWVYYVGPIIGMAIAAVWFLVQRNSRTEQ
jgi:glycerol uptake facilitator-like aquaporin